jgi:hypothetical protein
MVDRLFSDAGLAALYDLFCPWGQRGDFDFHLPLGRSTLRFLDADSVSWFLSDAGLAIEEQFGDWDRQPLTDASPEIITIARLA